MKVDDHARFRGKYLFDRFAQLLAAIASARPEDVAGETLGVKPHERGAAAADVAFDQREVFASIDHVAIDGCLEFAREHRKIGFTDALDEQFIRQPVRNQVLDIAKRNRMIRRHRIHLSEPRRAAVLAAYRTDYLCT